MPALQRFAPELLLVSAGFDGHRADSLAQPVLGTDGFAWATERLTATAGETCGGRLISTPEGSYDLTALAAASAAHVRVLMAA